MEETKQEYEIMKPKINSIQFTEIRNAQQTFWNKVDDLRMEMKSEEV